MRNSKRQGFLWICFMVLGFMIQGCAADQPKPKESEWPDQALEYRVYRISDGASEEKQVPAKAKLQVSYFRGLLTDADAEQRFGDEKSFAIDAFGNGISPLAAKDQHLMSMVTGKHARNWLSIASDGLISSSVDIDGDRVVDLVDTITSDHVHTIIANELGREFLSEWLKGLNPLCDDIAGFGSIPLFGCDDADSGGGPGGGEGPGGAGIGDPLEDICAEYRDGQTAFDPSGGVYTHGGHGWGRLSRAGVQSARHSEDGGITYRWYTIGARVYFDDAGNHVSTYREVRYWDTDGNLVRTVEERVDHDGNGTRTVIDHNADGTRTTRSSRFRTTVNSDGTYSTPPAMNDPDAPDSHKEYYNESDDETRDNLDNLRRWPEEVTGTGGETHPGTPDVGVDGDWEIWCKATAPGQNPSGLEIVTVEDHGLFDKEICIDSLNGSTGQNCITIDSSRLMDIESVLDPPGAGTNCGDFEQPGPDGTCGPASGIIRLLGQHVDLSAIKIDDIEICDPLVCQPGFFD